MAHRTARLGIVVALPALMAAILAPSTAGDVLGAANENEVTRAIVLRQKLGFSAEPDFVGRTFVDSRYSASRFGIPLSDAEVADLEQRLAIRRAIEPAISLAREHPRYSGVFIDHAQGGVPVFLTTADPAAFALHIQDIVPRGAPYRVENVALTFAELRRLQERLIEDIPTLALEGIEVVMVGLVSQENSVSVGLKHLNPSISESVRTRYGSQVLVREIAHLAGGDGACSSGSTRGNCWPLMGGLKIWQDNYESSRMCTSGMIVRLAQTADLQFLTAGHCIGKTGGAGINWAHRTANGSEVIIGEALTHTWQNGSLADAGLIDIDAGDYPATKNLYFAADSQSVWPFQGYEFSSAQGDVGNDFVCRSGWKSGYRCGLVITQDAQKDVDGRTILHQWEVDFDACKGDSGGPYLLGYEVWGIHSDSDEDDGSGCNVATGTAWYSPIQWAMSALLDKGKPIVLCLDADC